QPNLRMFTQLISQARDRVRIVSPYFVPDEALLHTITSAAFRGVDVELFVPEHADQFLVHHAQRSYFRALLEASVRIPRFRTPAVMHTKMLLIDDYGGTVGSSNMDVRSFNLNFEISVLALGGAAVGQMHSVVERYLDVFTTLVIEVMQLRNWLRRNCTSIERLTSALQ